MKLKKLTISILIIFSIISMSSKCFAKCVYEYTKKAADIIINN